MSDFVGPAFGEPTLPRRPKRPRDDDDLTVRTNIEPYLPPAERRRARQQRILEKLVEVGWAKDLTEAAFIELKRAEGQK